MQEAREIEIGEDGEEEFDGKVEEGGGLCHGRFF